MADNDRAAGVVDSTGTSKGVTVLNEDMLERLRKMNQSPSLSSLSNLQGVQIIASDWVPEYGMAIFVGKKLYAALKEDSSSDS